MMIFGTILKLILVSIIGHSCFMNSMESSESLVATINTANWQLIEAIIADDFAAAEAALDRGVDVNMEIEKPKYRIGNGILPKETRHCRTPLGLAVFYNRIKIVRLLLDHGSHVNGQIHESFYENRLISYLQFAIEHGFIDLARLLYLYGAERQMLGSSMLSSGFDVNDVLLPEPLVRAAAAGQNNLVKKILQSNPSPREKQLACAFAVSHGSEETIKTLIEAQADTVNAFHIATILLHRVKPIIPLTDDAKARYQRILEMFKIGALTRFIRGLHADPSFYFSRLPSVLTDTLLSLMLERQMP